MVRYRHDMQNVTIETARALLGKKGYIVDAVQSILGGREYDYSFTIYPQSESIRCYIAHYGETENRRFERAVEVCIGGKNSMTDATRFIYDKDKPYHPLEHATYYRDWIVPSEKKFREILYKTF